MTPARSPSLIRRLLRFGTPFLRLYYRAECDGLERLGPGPHFLIANHSAGAAVEPFILLMAWERDRPGIPVYGMAHRFVYFIPGLRMLFWKLGGIPATHEEARARLRRGESVVIFPGGDWEAMRPFWKAKECDFGGRQGWARIAIEEGVPVVPVAISGSHRTNLFFFRSRVLSLLLVLPAIFQITWFSISLAQVVFPALWIYGMGGVLSPWILYPTAYLIFLVSALFAFLPAKISVHVLNPIPPAEYVDSDFLYTEVVRRITARLRQKPNSSS